jgi:hypothetical protein
MIALPSMPDWIAKEGPESSSEHGASLWDIGVDGDAKDSAEAVDLVWSLIGRNIVAKNF